MSEFFKPGDKVMRSGIYKVIHGEGHYVENRVTAVNGESFPACRRCGNLPRFMLLQAAHHFSRHPDFKR
jgi:hypothetical protein